MVASTVSSSSLALSTLLPHISSQKHDGTVIVYGPALGDIGPGGEEFLLLSQENWRVAVPQLRYTCGNTQKGWEPKPTIYFSTSKRPGVKLSDVIQGKFNGVDGRDEFPFGEDCRGITIRMHVRS